MNTIICSFHSLNSEAAKILEDPRNADLLSSESLASSDAGMSIGSSALTLTLDRAPKTGTDFVIGRHEDSDIVLYSPTSSSRHCTISVDDRGAAVLHEQSKNGSVINGKLCKASSVVIHDKMQIEIRGALFLIRVPWRQGTDQADYAYKARRYRETREVTPLDSPAAPTAVHTAWVETIGPYEIVGSAINKLQVAGTEIGSIELARKGGSWYAAKKYKMPGLGRRELHFWKRFRNTIEHVSRMIKKLLSSWSGQVNIIGLEDIFEDDEGPLLIMEFTPLGNLRQTFDEPNLPTDLDLAIRIMRQLLEALEHLHCLKIVHRGIRLENLLIVSKQPLHIKLTGFEFAAYGEGIKNFLNVPGYEAPEVWERSYRSGIAPHIWDQFLDRRGVSRKSLPSCGSSIDIWSAGAICCELTLNTIPRYVDKRKSWDEQGEDYVTFLLDVTSGDLMKEPKIWAQRLGLPLTLVSPLLIHFLQGLLHLNPDSRVKANDSLKDPWFDTRSHEQEQENLDDKDTTSASLLKPSVEFTAASSIGKVESDQE